MSGQAAVRPIREWAHVDEHLFRTEILPTRQPAILRGLVQNWPAVRHATQSAEALCEYLIARDSGKHSDVVLVPPEFRGRMFYNSSLDGFNFIRNKLSLTDVIRQIVRYSHFDTPPSVAMQCAPVAECMPEFEKENLLPILGGLVSPRLWIGNAFITPAHFDEPHNLACVVSGTRRFTLFPPEQVANLYVGPLEFTPAGAPVSLVSLEDPDFERFPKFQEALDAASFAELAPGDAIYIPPVWWHHVRSFDPLNLLVNYWWREPLVASPPAHLSPVKALLHCMLSMQELDAAQKEAWGAIFSHFAFGANGDAGAHLPAPVKGVEGALTPEQIEAKFKALF